MHVPPWLINHSVLQPIHGCLPALAHLAITPCFLADTDTFTTLFDHCPSLKSFATRPRSNVRISVPSSQIRKLCVCEANIASCMAFLASFPHFRTLELDTVGGGNDPGENLVSNLDKLSIEQIDEPWELFDFIDNATLPTLSSIHLVGYLDDSSNSWIGWWQQESFVNFLQRSSCNVTTFCLKWLPISDIEMMQLLRLMPSLTNLHLEEYRANPDGNQIVTSHFLESLAFNNASLSISDPLIPSLSDLSFVAHDKGLDKANLVALLSSRLGVLSQSTASDPSLHPLKSFHLTVLLYPDDEEGRLSSLNSFGKAGLQLTLSHTRVYE